VGTDWCWPARQRNGTGCCTGCTDWSEHGFPRTKWRYDVPSRQCAAWCRWPKHTYQPPRGSGINARSFWAWHDDAWKYWSIWGLWRQVKVFCLTSILNMYCKIGHVSDTRDNQKRSNSERFDNGEGSSSANLGPPLNASSVASSMIATAKNILPAFQQNSPAVQTPPQQQLYIKTIFPTQRTDSPQSSPMFQQRTSQQMQQMSPWPQEPHNSYQHGPYKAPLSNSPL
jgi:hypothetical protein